MRVSEAYNNWSSTYDSDRNLTRDLDEQVTRDALSLLKVNALLEIGCGTGKNSRLLSQLAREMVALDFSTGMLQQARAKVSSDRVLFAVADLIKPWPLLGNRFDLTVCNLVLEHIEDLGSVFTEVSRTLAPGGRLFISELHPARQYRGAVANFQRGDSQIEVAAFVHHISDFLEAARANGLSLLELREWWHEEDVNKPPRLVSFMFEKSSLQSEG